MLQSAVFAKLAILVCLCALTNLAAAGIVDVDDPRPTNATGSMRCITDVSANTLNVSMVIYKNTSTVTHVFFMEKLGDFYRQRYDNASCLWSGTGEEGDPFSVDIKIDLSTNLTLEGTSNCGHVISGDYFIWYAFAQVGTGLLVTYDAFAVKFKCRPGDLRTIVSTEVDIELPDTIYPQTQYGEPRFGFYLPGSNNLLQTLDLQVGDLFHIGLEFLPDNPNEIEASPWGAYCKVLYATPTTDDAYRRFDLLDNSGCPHTDNFLGPFTSMIGAKPQINTKFSSKTGPIYLERFDRTIAKPLDEYDTVYFSCQVYLCILPNDQTCIDRCPSSVIQRKRSETTTFNLVANITIRDRQITNPEGTQNYMVPILASTGGFLVLLLVILVVVFLCCHGARRYRQHYNSSSDVSDSRPYGSSRKSSGVSRGSSNYSVK